MKRNGEKLLFDLAGVAEARAMRALGRAVKPRLVTLNVTDRCNCRCSMCDIHARAAGDEISLDDVEKLFSDPELSRLDVLRITGGEPFIRGDIAEIFLAAQRLTPVRIIYITTNGGFPQRAEEFARKALPSRAALHLQVSIDALDARHDAMRGVPGALTNALETLDILAGIKKTEQFHLGINQTVLPDTLDQIHAIAELAAASGAGHNIILAAKNHEGKDMSRVSLNASPLPFEPQSPMTREQVETFYRECADMKRSRHLAKVREDSASAMMRDISEEYLNEGGRARLLHGRNRPAPPCMAMFTHCRITAAGDVIPCSVLASAPVGNIRKNTFTEIWNSKEAASLRERVAKCAGCWIECDINPSIFYSGDIVRWAARKMIMDSEFRKTYFNKVKY